MNHYVTWSAQKDVKTLDVVKSEDTFFFLPNGQKIDDFTSTSFQACFGHSAKRITQAIENRLHTLPMASPKMQFELKEQVSKRLLNFLKFSDGKIFYTVSGAESVENALKISRQITNKKIILARRKSYHGASLGALSVTGDWRNANHFTVDDWTVRIPEPEEDPHLKTTREIIKKIGAENIAGFCLETITGTNGVIIADTQWWNGIQQLRDEFGFHLILDEVLTGFGRTGHAFAFHRYNLKPDFVTMSKGISGGYIPFGALWTSQKVADYYENNVLSCGLTNCAHPLGLAALASVLDYFEDSAFTDNLVSLEKLFATELKKLEQKPTVKEVRVAGLLAAIEMKESGLLKTKTFLDNNLFVFLKDKEIILGPPLTYKYDDMTSALARLEKSL